MTRRITATWDGKTFVLFTGEVQAGEWHHVVAIKEAVYVDGVKQP